MVTPSVVWLLALASLHSSLHIDGKHFRDSAGRVVLLRGVNMSGDSKVPPYATISTASLDPLPDWGVNVIRLVFTWEAFEPHPGTYSRAYLDYITDIVRAAAKLHLYVLLDFHQDAFSRSLLGGCGDGFPAWAVAADVPRSAPKNGALCRNWAVRMVVDADMHRAWTAFYKNEGAARQHFIRMTQEVVRALAAEKNILGYDLLNEPWGDEVHEIAALYQDEAAALRAVDPNSILFVSPHAITSSGIQTDLPRPIFGNFVYAPHFYDNWVMVLQVWLGNSLEWTFAKMRGKADEWQVPLFLGEFGAPNATRGVSVYMKTLHERLNEGFVSGTQWSYTPGWTATRKDGWNQEDLSIVDNFGSWRANFKPRPYPQKVAGTPLTLKVTDELNARANQLDFSWDNVPAAGATEIFVPQAVFLADAPLVVRGAGAGLQCHPGPGHLVTCASGQNGTMRVVISGH